MVGLQAAQAAGLRSVRAAHERAGQAAEEVTRASLVEPDRVTISGEQPPDMVRGLVDLRVARYQQTASLKVLETADEMQREVLEMT